MKKKIRVQFHNFYSTFPPLQSLEYRLLSRYYEVELVDSEPDLVCTAMGNTKVYKTFKVPILAISCENFDVLPSACDISITPNEIDSESHYQHSNIIGYNGMKQYLSGQEIPLHIQSYKKYPKTKFCAFLYRNSRPRHRKRFCLALMKYKRVDCLGEVLRNNDLITVKEEAAKEDKNFSWEEQQLSIYKDYKFSIAFENSSDLGYVTEKITQALLVGSIPIYWGAPDVEDYINSAAFIHVRNFKSYQACIDYVREVDQNPELYQKYLDAPMLLPSSKLYRLREEKTAEWLKPQLERVLASGFTPKRKISPFWFRRMRYYHHKRIKETGRLWEFKYILSELWPQKLRALFGCASV